MAGRTEEIDHTADMGFKAWAATLEELFVVCARAMFEFILAGTVQSSNLRRFPLKVSAASEEDLLREWLAELLFLHSSQRVFFTSFEIEIEGGISLTGAAHGAPMDERMIEKATEIKAVTYHGLRVARIESGFEAQVIFDS